MEDTHTVITNFQGNPTQAFFGFFDGHGGRKAAEFVAGNLSQHIANAMQNEEGQKEDIEAAVRTGYLTTDSEFLAKRVSSGACSVTALIKDGQMVVANAGDCKAVLSRSGKAEVLTINHRACNDVERKRIESLGGYVDCFSGVWRVQGTLAVARGFGDMHLKKWISAEPDMKKLELKPDFKFLILASDGLWDKVGDQEAVDCARDSLALDLPNNHQELQLKAQKCEDSSIAESSNHKDDAQASIKTVGACQKLVAMATQRGSMDDIAVIIVQLQHFCKA